MNQEPKLEFQDLDDSDAYWQLNEDLAQNAHQTLETDIPGLEGSFMRDFTCCGHKWPTLHDLLRHYEEKHSRDLSGVIQPTSHPRSPARSVTPSAGRAQQGMPQRGQQFGQDRVGEEDDDIAGMPMNTALPSVTSKSNPSGTRDGLQALTHKRKPMFQTLSSEPAWFTLVHQPAHEAADGAMFPPWKAPEGKDTLASLTQLPVSEHQKAPNVSIDDLHTNQTPHATTRQPPTMYDDSGYGSLGTKSVAPGLGKLDAIQERAELVHSGVDKDEEMQETRTIFSDAASLLQNPDVDKYISAFAKELATSLPQEFDASYLDAVPSTLDHLLKSFAVRLGHEGSGHPQRQLMYSVYRFRRSAKTYSRSSCISRKDC